MDKILAKVDHTFKLTDNDYTHFELNGKTPNALMTHTIEKTYDIYGIMLEDLVKNHGNEEFNYNELKNTFSTFCKDFTSPVDYNTASKAVEFASLMIYEVGPEARRVKKNVSDKVWKFRFPYVDTKLSIKRPSEKDYPTKELQDKYNKTITARFNEYTLRRKGSNLVMNTPEETELLTLIESTKCLNVYNVYVATFKTANADKITTDNSNYRMTLTMKQAGLLAMEIFSKAIITVLTNNASTKLITPLCGAIFSVDSLDKMCEKLSGKYGYPEDLNASQLLVVLNCSCQPSGHYLEMSDLSVAAVAVVCATRNMKQTNICDSIISKTIKQYFRKGKEFNSEAFVAICGFATGGLPDGITPNYLVKLLDDTESRNLNLKRALMEQKLTQQQAVVPAPILN